MPIYAIDGVVPAVDPSSFVHPEAVLIGDVIVGPDCYIAPGASLRGDMGRLIVGAGCNVQDGCVLHCFPGADCVIEDWGHIGHGTVLHGCTIGRNALVGMNSVVMDGAVIGAESIVAAMAFVPAGMQVPERTLIAGIPAKPRREVTDDEVRWKMKGTEEYQRLAARSRETLRPVEPLPEPEPDRPRVDVAPHDPLHVAKGKSSG